MAAVIVAGTVALAACGQEESAPDVMPDADAEVFAHRWSLVSASADGIEVHDETLKSVSWQFTRDGGCLSDDECPSGTKVTGSDGCNDFARSIDIGGGEASWGEYWESTAVGCSGPTAEVMGRVFDEPSFRYDVGSNRLVVATASDSIQLRFEVDESLLGPADGTVVQESAVTDLVYRLVWDGSVLMVEHGDLNTSSRRPERSGLAVEHEVGAVRAARGRIGDETLVVALVPEMTEKVVYETMGTAEALSTHQIPDVAALAVGQPVSDGAAAWTLVAFDRAGDELGRFASP